MTDTVIAVATPSVRRRGTPKLPREQRAVQVLDAATVEFGSVGYGAASLSAIADRIGVSKALVLTYFGSKDDLYLACVTRAGSNLAGRIEEVITTSTRPAEMAQRTLAVIFEGLEGRPHDWNVLNDHSLPLGSRAHEIVHDQRRAIADQARRGVRAFDTLRSSLDDDELDLLTEIWMSAVTAAVNWWLRHPESSASAMAERCEAILTALGDIGKDREDSHE